jgi:SAM-dependent methyltransferase
MSGILVVVWSAMGYDLNDDRFEGDRQFCHRKSPESSIHSPFGHKRFIRMEAHHSTVATALTYPEAVRALLDEFTWNSWFLNSYWPENEPRIRLVSRLALERFPDAKGLHALEVGCANGYVAYLFRLLGFDVSAVDAYEDEKRTELFRKGGITYRQTNLNAVDPLSEFAQSSFDLILLGEVFEHILNQPTNLLRSILRMLRPGGLLILTTPNPSTLANAVRVLKDTHMLWGTPEFLRDTKLDGDKIIDRGDIHYREYPAWIVRDLMAQIGFRIEGVEYVRTGSASSHSFGKRFVKSLLRMSGLAGMRVLSPGYVIWASKPN